MGTMAREDSQRPRRGGARIELHTLLQQLASLCAPTHLLLRRCVHVALRRALRRHLVRPQRLGCPVCYVNTSASIRIVAEASKGCHPGQGPPGQNAKR